MRELETVSRANWVSACQFHDLEDMEVLDHVAKRVTEEKNPSVLLDLDSTLYQVRPRTHQILKEWAKDLESRNYPEFRAALLEMAEDRIGYSVNDTFATLPGHETDRSAAAKSARQFWNQRFFTNFYLKYDRAYPGAADFAQRLHRLGAKIIYLTGRDEPNMGEGTRMNLLRDGFPWNLSGTYLLMKPSFHISDLDYKRGTVESIRSYGNLVASFENEPPNVVAFSQLFPDAMHIFVDTVCAEQPALPCSGLYRIRGYHLDHL